MLTAPTQNQKAFLDMIAMSEGTKGKGDDGYNMIVNPGGFFNSYADHPRVLVKVSDTLSSTAAGRYQLLARFYDYYKGMLKLPNFSPTSQDAIALQQIKECGALDAIESGDIPTAIKKCSHIWASFPGSPYGQPTHTVGALLAAYASFGGILASS
jgi:muramidase (phage lysozyme)